MRTEKILAAVIGLLLLRACLPSHGATYYIDFATGSDANPGTTQSSPKKLHPYMRGYAGTYTHTAGDRFIFKGGVTWPNSCFTMNVLAGGTSGSPDYYGVDQTWYTGGSFVAPIFDAGGVELNGGFDVFVLLNLGTAPSYITFDGFDMRNLFWTGPKSFSQVAFFNLSVSHDVTIANCWMHNWTHGTLASGTTDILKCVIGSNSSPWNPGCVVTGCLIDGENAANSTNGSSSGEGTYAYSGNILNTTVRNAASGFIVTGDPANHTVPQVVSGCNIGPSYVSFDPNEHPDGLFMNGGNYFQWHDNYIHDCNVEVVFTGEGSGDEDTYIWNNVIWNGTTHSPIEIDNTYSGARIWAYHNTLVSGSFPGVRVINRGNGPLGVLDFRNNFVISDAGAVSIDAGGSITHYTNQNTVVMPTASASVNGFNAATLWKPQSTNQPCYNAGQSLSTVLSGALANDILLVTRPQGTRWDAGAYEWAPSGAGSISLVYPTYSIPQTGGFVPVTAVRQGGTQSFPLTGYGGPLGDGQPTILFDKLDTDRVIVGFFSGTITFGTFTLTSAGAFDVFVVKFDANGTPKWATQYGGASSDSPRSASLDGSDNIYVTGILNGKNLIKFSSAGALQWSAQVGSVNATASLVTSDKNGTSAFMAGTFTGNSVTFGTNTLFGFTGQDTFLVRVSPVDGSTVWARVFAADDANSPTGMNIDAVSGNLFITGNFLGRLDISNTSGSINTNSPNLMTTLGQNNFYVGKFKQDSTFLFSQRFGSTGNDLSRALEIDSQGNCFVGGTFTSPSLNLGLGAMALAGTRDVFLAKFNATNGCVWSRSMRGTLNPAIVFGMGVDPSGNVGISGSFNDQINLGAGTVVCPSGSTYGYAAKYGGQVTGLQPANYLWSITLVSPTCNAYKIGFGQNGLSTTVGSFSGTVSLGGQTIASQGSTDVFVAGEGDTSTSVSVNVNTQDGTAVAGVDYTALSSSFAWAAGSYGAQTKPVNILVSGATTNRTFTVSLSGGSGGPWAQGFGGAANNDFGSAVTTDASGNIYLVGFFVGPATFGGSTLNGRGMVLAKYNSAGVHQWSFPFQSTTTVNPNSIALDSAGNILVAGFFNDTVNFGGGNVTSAGSADAFVAKYTSAGSFVWVKTFGSTSSEGFNAVAVDSANNVLVTGWFTGTVSYGGPTPLTSSFAGFAQNVVLAKYNSAGAWQWATNFTSTYYNSGASVNVDGSDNVLFSGAFFQSINFGGGVLNAVSNTYATIFVAKVNSAGVYQWAKAHAGPSSQNVVAGVVDHNGDLIIGGGYYRQTDLGGGTITGVAVNQDGYLAKYSGLNGNYLWSRNITVDNGIWPKSAAVDSNNNIVLGGYFYGKANFGNVSLPSVAISYDGFAATYDSGGTPITAQAFGGTGTDQANGVAYDPSGNQIITGIFNGSATFGGQTLTSLGLSDAFLYRVAPGVALGPITTEVVTITPPPIQPQPTNAGSISFTSASWSTASTNASVTLSVIRSGSTNIDTSVSYSTANGTAISGTDYTTASGSLSWASNENSTKTVTVNLINSGATGGTRTFTVTLSAPSNGATLGTAVATVTIQLPPTPIPGTIALSAASASVSENSTNIVITGVRSGGSDGAVTVHIATSDQTATSGHDYTGISTTLSWGNGVNGGQSVNVPILQSGDTANTNRTFIVTISAPTGGASLGSPTVETVTIIMNPPPAVPGNITLSSTNYTTTSSSGTVVLTVIRNGSTNAAASINYATSNGTATSGVDYTATSGTLNWATNDNSAKTITVTIINSGAVGTNRVFNVALSAPSAGVTTGITNATVTIQLPSPSPGSIALTSSAASVSQNSTNIVVTVVRSNGTNGIVSVSFATSNQTATAGHDYTAVSTTVTWGDGVFGPQTVNVPILQSGDTATTNRTFLVTISGATGGATLIAPTTEVVTIIMNPPPSSPGNITLSSTNYITSETSGTVTLTVIRSGSTNAAASINYATANGTATAGVDYTTTTGTLSWSTNQNTAQTITVPILNSGAISGTRVFTVSLSGASSGVTLGTTSATVTIQLPSPVPGNVSLSASAASVSENSPSITITAVRSSGSNGAISVNAATANGSATSGHDYTGVSTTLNWADGIFGNQTFTVPILQSGDVSNTDRTFTVTLSSPAGGATLISPTVETITIVMNRPSTNAGSVTPSKSTFSVPSTAGSLTIPLTRSGGTNVAVSVNYFTSDGTAKAGTDYTATFGSLSWTNNENTTKNIVVPITNTGKTGSPLSFTVIFSTSPGGPSLPTSLVAVSITLNNIAPPSGLRISGEVIATGPVTFKFTP